MTILQNKYFCKVLTSPLKYGNGSLLGPLFFERNVTGIAYLETLKPKYCCEITINPSPAKTALTEHLLVYFYLPFFVGSCQIL